ncbi:uncharacterized protein LOC125504559, partial [Dendroctonus ponderosae]|uniref:uncharacterized protein LOC125504559 n=1 Tax=Dendroctonus ponderosae TaxID=77166 RepID=UPI002035BE01
AVAERGSSEAGGEEAIPRSDGSAQGESSQSQARDFEQGTKPRTLQSKLDCTTTGVLRSRRELQTNSELAREADHLKKRECAESAALSEALDIITRPARNLETRIENNTRGEIKDISVKLKRQISTVGAAIRNWLDINKYINTGKATQNAGTQTVVSLECYQSYSALEGTLNKKWDPVVYINTEIKEGNPLDTEDSTTKVLLIYKNGEAKESLIERLFVEKHPEMRGMEEDFGILEQKINIRMKSPTKTTNKKVVKIAYKEEEDLFKKLARLQEETAGDKGIATHQTRGIKTGRLRKMLEGIFHNTESKVEIFTRANALNQATTIGKKLGARGEIGTKQRKTFALVVGNKEKSYEENLKSVKKTLMENNLAEGIKELRSTRDGRLLITTDKQQEIVEEIRSALHGNKDVAEHVRIVGRHSDKVPIHIRGLESLATKEDLVAALNGKFSSIKESDYSLSDLRPNANCTQAVTLLIRREMANELLEGKHIKIGLVRCSMEARINLQRCSKCWECTKEPSCPICQKKGHRAGSGKCDAFKASLTEVKKALRKEAQRLTRREPKTTGAPNNKGATPPDDEQRQG